MKYIIKISISLITILSIFSTEKTFSQSNILFGMPNIPQTINSNPAKQPNCSFYLGFPALSNLYSNVNNSALTINTIFEPNLNAPDSFFLDLNAIETAMEPMNYINLEQNISIIDFGFSIFNGYFFSFSISNKTFENFGFSKSLFDVQNGNYNENGYPISFSFYQNFTNYNEFSAGLSKTLLNNLTIGAKLKLLSGNYNLSSSKLNIDWQTETSPDSLYEWTFNTDVEVNSSSIYGLGLDLGFVSDFSNSVPIDSLRISRLILSPNTGFAIDLGIEYLLFEKLKLSASLIDLGYITWQTNSKSLTQSGTFRYTGIDLANYISSIQDFQNSGTIGTQITQDLKDSILTFIAPTITEKAYTTSLNTKIYTGANFLVSKNFDVGFLYKGLIYDKSLFSSYTFSLNTYVGKGWSLSANYSLMYGLYNNIGLGVSLKLGPLQFYLITDNMAPMAWASNQSDFTDRWIRNTKGVTFQAGLNFVAFRNKTDYGLIE